jgi:hypothetical protein
VMMLRIQIYCRWENSAKMEIAQVIIMKLAVLQLNEKKKSL